MRVAIFGSTGRGNYGHQIDLGFAGRSDVEICAVADPDATGRLEAMKRVGVARGYDDYETLLREERPEIVAVATRFPEGHVAMVKAALSAGCHVYCEKPLAVDLVEADAMVAMADDAGLRLAIALPFVHEPRFAQLERLIADGAVGEIIHLRAFTKCDHRGGGQDVAVLGPHLFDMMRRVAGNPLSCSAVVNVGRWRANLQDVREGDEAVGPIMGDRMCATYTFDSGICATLHSYSTRDLVPTRQPYRLEIYGDRGAIAIRAPYGDHGLWQSRAVAAGPGGPAWEAVPTEAIASHAAYHALAVTDLMRAIAEKRDPLASGRDGRSALEMSHAIYASHLAGTTVRFPLADRSHPLTRRGKS